MVESEPTQLSEFKVTLQRVAPGESAIAEKYPKNLGLRTKLGGNADWIQDDDTPNCERCHRRMTFVAQIDSIEHISLNNPIGLDFKNQDKSKLGWMFGDVGMIYVFYCLRCGETQSRFQCY